jgi:hypothetical protein
LQWIGGSFDPQRFYLAAVDLSPAGNQTLTVNAVHAER